VAYGRLEDTLWGPMGCEAGVPWGVRPGSHGAAYGRLEDIFEKGAAFGLGERREEGVDEPEAHRAHL
jgi:hypothetical protein